MTNEEAIKQLNMHKSTNVWADSIAEAIDMAIEALTYQNLSKPNTTCEVDIISRADAIEAVRKELVCDGRHETHDKVCRFIADVILTALPSADIYCPSCGIRLVSEHEYVEPPYKGGDTE